MRMVLRYDFNCLEQTAVTNYRAFRKENQTRWTGYETPWLKREPILPGSVIETISDRLCN